MDATPFAPMEARLAEALPSSPGWQYEPKWDGFRAIAVREGDIEIWSKSGKPLGRYFPEMIEALATIPEKRFILDGEEHDARLVAGPIEIQCRVTDDKPG